MMQLRGEITRSHMVSEGGVDEAGLVRETHYRMIDGVKLMSVSLIETPLDPSWRAGLKEASWSCEVVCEPDCHDTGCHDLGGEG